MWRLVLGLSGILMLASACAETNGGPSASASQQCTQNGGVWRAGLDICEKGSGGGGGGY